MNYWFVVEVNSQQVQMVLKKQGFFYLSTSSRHLFFLATKINVRLHDLKNRNVPWSAGESEGIGITILQRDLSVSR